MVAMHPSEEQWHTKGMPDVYCELLRTADQVVEFLSWLDAALQRREPIAVDTETVGLNWTEYAFVRLVQFGTTTEGWAIPVAWWGKVIEEAMRRIVEHGATVVMHNSAFDMHALESAGYPVPAWANVVDTKILLHLRRSDLPGGLKSKHVADILGYWIFQGKNELESSLKEHGLKAADKWRWLPLDDFAYWGYACLDTILSARLYQAIKWVADAFPAPYEREMRFLGIMYRAEKRGIRVDTTYTERLAERMDADIRHDRATLQVMGLENPNSGDQLLALLEEDYNFVPEVFTDNGNPSLDKYVLNALAQAGGMQAELVEVLMRYKRLVKWRAAYVGAFLHEVDIHGKVHPSVNTTGAKTGRLSIQNPPLQTLPGKQALIRSCLLPHKGERWYSIDWSNQEPRLLAHYGQSADLLAYFNQGDGTGSIHDFVAERLFGPGYSQDQRSVAKIFGLSRSYGAGATKMAAASGADLAFVEAILPDYDQLMGLAELNLRIAETVAGRMPEPYITSLGGRRIYSDPNEVYKLTNYLMQGSGADISKMAAVEAETQGLDEAILVSVHDEYCLSLPKDEGPELARQFGQIMEGVADLSVRLPVDIDGPGKSWGQLYEGKN